VREADGRRPTSCSLRRFLGELDAAVEHARRHLAVRRAVFPADHPNVASAEKMLKEFEAASEPRSSC